MWPVTAQLYCLLVICNHWSGLYPQCTAAYLQLFCKLFVHADAAAEMSPVVLLMVYKAEAVQEPASWQLVILQPSKVPVVEFSFI